MRLSEIAFRNIFRNGRRSLLSITAIAVAAFSITFLFALLEGITVDVRQNALNYESGEVRLRNAEYDRYEYLNPVQYVVPNYQELIQHLDELDSTAAISPRIQVPSAYFHDEKQVSAVAFGLDIELERRYQDLEAIVASGRLPRPGTDQVIIGTGLAQDLGVETGDIATFLTRTRYRGSNAFTVDVVGLAQFPVGALNNRAMIIPIDRASRYMRMGDGVTEILIKGHPDHTENLIGDVRSVLEEHGPEEVTAVHWTEISSGYEYLQIANIVYRIMALIFFLLAATVIISTTMMIVHERTREIGTLSALGMSDSRLIRLFFTEAAYLGAFGALLGVLLGAATVLPFSLYGLNLGSAMEGVDMDISNVLYPVLNLNSTLGVFIFSWVVSMAATYPSARRAAKLQPVVALRAEN